MGSINSSKKNAYACRISMAQEKGFLVPIGSACAAGKGNLHSLKKITILSGHDKNRAERGESNE